MIDTGNIASKLLEFGELELKTLQRRRSSAEAFVQLIDAVSPAAGPDSRKALQALRGKVLTAPRPKKAKAAPAKTD